MDQTLFQFSWWALKNPRILKHSVMAVQDHSRSVVDFGTNRKRVCNFFFAINSKVGPIWVLSYRFRDIAGFMLKTATPPRFHPNFWGCYPWTKSPIVGAPKSEDLSLISANYFRSNPTFMTTTSHQCCRRTNEKHTMAIIPHYARVHRAVKTRAFTWTATQAIIQRLTQT